MNFLGDARRGEGVIRCHCMWLRGGERFEGERVEGFCTIK